MKEILHLREAPSTPLWCHCGRRYTRNKVEARNPVLWKAGTQEGQGSQWCNRLPTRPPEEIRGGRGSGWYAFFASYLTHPPHYNAPIRKKRKEG